MSEPTPPSLPPETEPGPRRPFAERPRALPGRGCSRPLLIGCATVIVLIGIAGIILVANARRLLVWTMGEFHDQVVAALPADVTPEERTRLDRGFDAASEKILQGKVEPPALMALQRQLTHAAEKAQAKSLTHDDVLDLLSALERVGGLLPAAPDEQRQDGPAPPESAPPGAQPPPGGEPRQPAEPPPGTPR